MLLSTVRTPYICNYRVTKYNSTALKPWNSSSRNLSKSSLIIVFICHIVHSEDIHIYLKPLQLLVPLPESQGDSADLAIMPTHQFWALDLIVVVLQCLRCSLAVHEKAPFLAELCFGGGKLY